MTPKQRLLLTVFLTALAAAAPSAAAQTAPDAIPLPAIRDVQPTQFLPPAVLPSLSPGSLPPASSNSAPELALLRVPLASAIAPFRYPLPATLPVRPLFAALAQDAAPAPIPEEDPTFMKYLARRGEHRLTNERWNAYGQLTYISDWKPGFSAAYTNLNGTPNSLLPTYERSFTGTATLYLGLHLWRGSEIYFVPELISERPLSQLKGIGGAIQDFELQKGGDVTPTLYRSRLYFKQVFSLGGDPVTEDSGPTQLGTTYTSHRINVVAGNFSILDFFDKNAFGIDPRQGLFNLAFLTYAAYDFASDARGYSWGLVTELFWNKWAVRFGHITPPRDPNQLPIDWRLLKFFGEQIELEHDHTVFGREGIVRVLGYQNHENIGRFSDAIAAFDADPSKNAAACTSFNYGSTNSTAPDLCWVRRPNIKVGLGAFAQQFVAPGIGLFARAMASDGKTEVDAYTSTDRSASAGVLARGQLWSRPRDLAGGGYTAGWISAPHSRYLGMGGIDGFVGDGRIRTGPESALDAFYSLGLHKVYWVSGDYQRLINPAFNRDRGPVNIFSLRLHGEF